MHNANALATRPALSTAATVCPTSGTTPKTAAPTAVPPKTPRIILPLRRGGGIVRVLVVVVGAGWGIRRDDRRRLHAHGTEEKVVVGEPRRSPRGGIRTRMTGKRMSRVERKRKLPYRRPTRVFSNGRTAGEERKPTWSLRYRRSHKAGLGSSSPIIF